MNQVGTNFIFPTSENAPILPSMKVSKIYDINLKLLKKYFLKINRYDIYWTTTVVSIGDELKISCQSRKNLPTVNKPVAWHFYDGQKHYPILRIFSVVESNRTLPKILPDDSIWFSAIKPEHSGVYKEMLEFFKCTYEGPRFESYLPHVFFIKKIII